MKFPTFLISYYACKKFWTKRHLIRDTLFISPFWINFSNSKMKILIITIYTSKARWFFFPNAGHHNGRNLLGIHSGMQRYNVVYKRFLFILWDEWNISYAILSTLKILIVIINDSNDIFIFYNSESLRVNWNIDWIIICLKLIYYISICLKKTSQV